MNNSSDLVYVQGDPVSAWLTASVIARFSGIDPRRIVVNESGAWGASTVLVRPETARLHQSIGLDIAALMGSRKVGGWTSGADLVPLSPFGAPLKSSSFQNVWARAQQNSDIEDLWSYNSMRPVTGMYELAWHEYAEVLKEIATSVGVSSCNGGDCHPILIIDARELSDDEASGGNTIKVGAALVGGISIPDLKLYALDICLRALIANWPRNGVIGPEVLEYHRRATQSLDLFGEMHALLNGLFETRVSLKHRMNVWRELGRVVPVGGDPFTEQEWIGALLHAGFVPAGYPRTIDAISDAEIHAHLSRCAVQDFSHGE